MKTRLWLLFAIVTTVFWGIWGAFIEVPEKAGFPATLGYSVWALTMVPCALVALKIINWKLQHDRRTVALGLAVGLLGAGGQIILFQALRLGPAYLIFPIVSLYPVLTVILSVSVLKERARKKSWAGIILAFPAIAMLSYQPPGSSIATSQWWIALASCVFVAWGVQAFVMKVSTNDIAPESIFFYMMLGGLAFIPAALIMTDFSQPINWGFRGPWAAALIQVLNSIGALCLVYAVRYGKAIIVVPMTALAPVLTVVISLALYQVVPNAIVTVGLICASLAIYLMAE
ncbi:MAG: DMT family transporter [Bryobacteraceae bacterium]|nr:DMT family transporter [Bryobacterales bacterium]MEB2361850.1 DMT family transporter [Bryobacterales bacterium]NUN03858.1 DMT family transporter [Bryobacteraceae bacterium]